MLEPDTLPLGILTEESDKLKNVRMIRNNKIKKTDMYLLIDYFRLRSVCFAESY